MSRFMIAFEQGGDLVWHAFNDMVGGEIYLKKIPSIKVTDVARAVTLEVIHDIVGIRPSEKLHGQMTRPEDAPHIYESSEHYKGQPAIHNWSQHSAPNSSGNLVGPGFTNCLGSSPDWMNLSSLQA